MAAAAAAAAMNLTISGQPKVAAVHEYVHVLVGQPPGVRFVIPGFLVRYFGILINDETMQDDDEKEKGPGQQQQQQQQKAVMAWPLIHPDDFARILHFYVTNCALLTNSQLANEEKKQRPKNYIFSLTDVIFHSTLLGPKPDIHTLIRLINGCNYLECEELLMVLCAKAAGHIVGRTVCPMSFQPEIRQQKDKCWTLLQEQLSSDMAFLVDRYLPFESEPLVPFEERRTFLTQWLVDITGNSLTIEELQNWPAFKLHSLAVDLQHFLWQRYYNCEIAMRTMIAFGFTPYDCVNLDRYLQRFVAQCYPNWAGVEEQMASRHLSRQQYGSAAAIANNLLVVKRRQEEAERHDYSPTFHFWSDIMTTDRTASCSGSEPTSYHILPLLSKESAEAAFDVMMMRRMMQFDWQSMLKLIALMPERAFSVRISLVGYAAIRGSLQMALRLANILGCEVLWGDILEGAFKSGDEKGNYLDRYVLNKPAFWKSPTCREDLREAIQADNGSVEQRKMLIGAINKRGWNAEFVARYLEAGWVTAAITAERSLTLGVS